jgi:hypothetical protein
MSCRRPAGVIAVVALIAASPAAGEVKSSLAAGMYDATLTTTIAGERQPPEKDHQCFTRSDLEHLETWVATSLGDDCSAENLRSSAPVITFDVVCAEDGAQVSTRVEMTIGDDSFQAVITSTEEIGIETLEGIYEIDAHRVSDCPSGSAE